MIEPIEDMSDLNARTGMICENDHEIDKFNPRNLPDINNSECEYNTDKERPRMFKESTDHCDNTKIDEDLNMRSTDEISPIYFVNNPDFINDPNMTNTEGDFDTNNNQHLKSSEIEVINEYQYEKDRNSRNEEQRPQSNYQIKSYRNNKLNGQKHKRILKSSYMTRRIHSEQAVNNINFHNEGVRQERSAGRRSDRSSNNYEQFDTESQQLLRNDEHQSEENEIQNEIKEIHNPIAITSRQQLLNERKGNAKIKYQKYRNLNTKEVQLQENTDEAYLFKRKVIDEELALLKAKNKLSNKTNNRAVNLESNEIHHNNDNEIENKESLNSKLDALKHNKYFQEREDRIVKEEKRK